MQNQQSNPCFQTKVCTKCQKEQSAYLDFSPKKPVCKKCLNEYTRAYRNVDNVNKWGKFCFARPGKANNDVIQEILST